MNAMLARNWWVMALRGVCAVLFGLIALLLPGVTIASLVLLFAAYMLVDGVFAIVAGVRAATRRERWWPFILEGVIDLAAGVVAVVAPIATILAFVWLSGAWAVVSGVMMIAAAIRLRTSHGKWWLGFGGLASIVWGILLFVAPAEGAVVMTWWLGAYALVFGGVLIVLAFRLRGHRNEPREAVPQGA
ncbi:HdeD family acid-resistance protein [Azospirillum brasilense]|nr:HdeD family acid-resistance protein [Azospirillum brasilense]